MNRGIAEAIIQQVEILEIEKIVINLLLGDDYKSKLLELSEKTSDWEFWHMLEMISEIIKRYYIQKMEEQK